MISSSLQDRTLLSIKSFLDIPLGLVCNTWAHFPDPESLLAIKDGLLAVNTTCNLVTDYYMEIPTKDNTHLILDLVGKDHNFWFGKTVLLAIAPYLKASYIENSLYTLHRRGTQLNQDWGWYERHV